MYNEIVTIGVFFAITLTVFLVGTTISAARKRAKNIADVGHKIRSKKPSAWSRSMAGCLPQAAKEVERIERDLKRAGYYRPFALVEYMATRNTLIVFVMIFTGVMAVAADPRTPLPKMILMTGLFVTVFSYAIPRVVLSLQARNRVNRIQTGLPDALDIIRMCLTGGLPLRDSLERVAQEIEFFHPDIAVEFEVIRRQADADTMATALKQFANRVDTPDVRALSALVSQTSRLGTHVATAVTEYSDSVRRAYRQKAEEKASKTSIKLLFPVVLCLTPPIFILLMGPPLLSLTDFIKTGHAAGGVLNRETYEQNLIAPQNQPNQTP